MKRVISFLQTIRLRQIITVFLAGITLWVSSAFGYGSELQAQANTQTPEATSSQVNRSGAEDAGDGLIDTLKSAADNVREKLNLDEPLPESTKEFLDTAKEKANEAVTAPQRAAKYAANSANSR